MIKIKFTIEIKFPSENREHFFTNIGKKSIRI